MAFRSSFKLTVIRLKDTLHHCVWLYRRQLPQSALRIETLLQAIMDWHKLKSELFNKKSHTTVWDVTTIH